MEGDGSQLPKAERDAGTMWALEGDREMGAEHKERAHPPQGHPTAASPSGGLRQSFAGPLRPAPLLSGPCQPDGPSWGWWLSRPPRRGA